MQTIDVPIYPLYPPPTHSDFRGDLPVLNEDGTVDFAMLKDELLLARIHSDFIDEYADKAIADGGIFLPPTGKIFDPGLFYEFTRKTVGDPPLLHDYVNVLFRVDEEFFALCRESPMEISVGDILPRPMALCEVANGRICGNAKMALEMKIRDVPHYRYCPECYDETPVTIWDALLYGADGRDWITPKPLPANAVCVA